MNINFDADFEDQFIKSILGDGCLVFGSETWVSRVFDYVRANDITKDLSESQFCTFFNAIEGKYDSYYLFKLLNIAFSQLFEHLDFDGSTGQLLSDLQRLEKVARHQIQSNHEIAGETHLTFDSDSF